MAHLFLRLAWRGSNDPGLSLLRCDKTVIVS